MALVNNITQDFYNNLNTLGSNPFVLIVLIVIIMIYYIIFSFLGSSYNYGSYPSNSNQSSGHYIIEALLWGIFILLMKNKSLKNSKPLPILLITKGFLNLQNL
jgi:hypothetical protein